MILPDASRVFRDRSRRFTALAKRYPLAEWLSFLGRLTRIQHELLQHYPSLPLPDEMILARAEENRTPPIADPSWPRDSSRRQALASLAWDLAPHAPPAARDTLERLQGWMARWWRRSPTGSSEAGRS